jgi:uncharacterized protein (TIGR00251 family)
LPFQPTPKGVRVAIRVTPRAARDQVTGLKPTAAGGRELCVALTAVPEKGRANKALIDLLAREWAMSKSELSVVAGVTDRHKAVMVEGMPDKLMAALGQWIERYSR